MMPAEATPRRIRGIALVLVAFVCVAVGDALSKLLTTTYPVGQIVAARAAIMMAIAFAICLWWGSFASLRPRSPKGQVRRALYFVAATFLANWSFKLLPLPMAHAILFATPIFITALAPFLLGEKVGIHRWSAVVAGFAGVFLVIDPVGAGWHWAAIVPLGAALASALRDLATREMVGTETTMSLLFIMAAATGIAGLMTAPFGWRMPDLFGLGLMLAFGLVSGAALLLQVLAYRDAEAALLAPFKYTTILWSILIAFVLWGYIPTALMFGGIAVVIVSGLYILMREMRLSRRAAPPATSDIDRASRTPS
jgi:drug/metabolite transporter (DMT)-like permease